MIFLDLVRCTLSFSATIPANCANAFTFQEILLLVIFPVNLEFDMLKPSLNPASPCDLVKDLKITKLGNSFIFSIKDKCFVKPSVNSIKLSSSNILVESLLSSTIFFISLFDSMPVGLLGLHKYKAFAFFAISSIESALISQFDNGRNFTLAPTLLEASSYSQNVGEGITTSVFPKDLAKISINSVAPFPMQI